jgi:hypothetical protein
MFGEINQLVRAASHSLLWLLRGLVPATAFAHTVYDGDWSVWILTRGSACEPSVRYGVQIADGMVTISGGGIATVQGRVTREWANGTSRLSRNRGGGAWWGEGTSTCRRT